MDTTIPAAPPVPYLRQPLPSGLIFGSFGLLTLPLAAVLVSALPQGSKDAIRLSYFWLFGLTHFVLTFTVYFRRENRTFFGSSWTNRVVYFGAPLFIFAGFDLYGAFGVAATLPALDVGFRLAIRFADFLHFGRQAFGVLQLFKTSWQGVFAPWLRRAENLLLWCLAILMLETFAYGGRFTADPWIVRATLVAFAALFALVVVGYVQAARRATDLRSVCVPATYLAFNLAAGGLAVSQTLLYFATLAIHYVEYHVLMAPRWFQSSVSPAARLDRVFDRIRRRPVVFYALLIELAALAALLPLLSGSMATGSGTPGYRIGIHLLDGLFVFHYFLEAFIWKFGDPFYRRTLGPLYLPR